jgi:indole-3-glycerol phosphate synthase
MSILDQILAKKREEVAELSKRFAAVAAPLGMVHRVDPQLESLVPRDFAAALRRPSGKPVRVLAEVKRASPSAGPIRPGADPVEVAREYADAGAAAISVLTDQTFFDGNVRYLMPCRAAVSVPVLRKDFIIDPIQLYEARANGADAVLLIAAALSPLQLQGLMRVSREYGLEPLVEVHSLAEADVALSSPVPPAVLGVNHRDLHTFAIDMTLTEQVAKRVPPGVVLVAESGIRTRDDVHRMGDAGAHAVLVGEHLMRAPSPGAALRELLS